MERLNLEQKGLAGPIAHMLHVPAAARCCVKQAHAVLHRRWLCVLTQLGYSSDSGISSGRVLYGGGG